MPFKNYNLAHDDLAKNITDQGDVFGLILDCEPGQSFSVWKDGKWFVTDRAAPRARFFIPMIEQLGPVLPPTPPVGTQRFSCVCDELALVGYYAVPVVSAAEKISDDTYSINEKDQLRTESLNIARILMNHYHELLPLCPVSPNGPASEQIARIAIECAKAVLEGTR